MNRQVVLLAEPHEEAARALSEVLRAAGIGLLLEASTLVAAGKAAQPCEEDGRCRAEKDAEFPLPLALLCEVAEEANVLEVHALVEHALAAWPGAPLVALRPGNGHAQGQPDRRSTGLDDATLKRLGFRAVAQRPAQLPALLRELEERGNTSELRLPTDVLAEAEACAPALPLHLNSSSLRASFELVASLHATHDQKSAAREALARLETLVGANSWTIYLSTETNGAQAVRLEPLAALGKADAGPESIRSVSTESLLALSGSESEAAREAAARMEMRRKTERGRRILALPLLSGERVMGVLEAVREGARARSFTRRETELLSALAAPLAHALANSVRIAEAERLSLTDDLTKLHNARYLRQFLLGELRRARRYGSSVSALFFDIDDFKSINDAHGHLVGSHVLMEMASVILSSVRDTDMVARYGGDEFVVVLPETPIEQAVYVAERVREKIARQQFTGGRRLQLQLTASFGVAAFPLHAPSPQQLVACADAAMYEAKAAGKNRVRTAL